MILRKLILWASVLRYMWSCEGFNETKRLQHTRCLFGYGQELLACKCTCASGSEDAWNEIFSIIRGERIVMHDNTDATRLMKSSDSEKQRATWSKYYSGCVGKGGIACQLCG
jgi:hypothetical protein